MLLMPAMGPGEAFFSGYYSRFTVGGEFCIRVFNVVNARKTGLCALKLLSSHHPFHCWATLSYVSHSEIIPSYERQMAHIQGVRFCYCSPVSLLDILDRC